MAAKKTFKKATNVEIEQRLNTIEEWLVMGLSRAKILLLVSEKTSWGVEERTVDHYLFTANKRWQARFEATKEERWKKHIDIRNRLLLDARKEKDARTALAIVQDIAKLEGMYPAEKMLVGSDKENPFEINIVTASERLMRIEELEKRRMLDVG